MPAEYTSGGVPMVLIAISSHIRYDINLSKKFTCYNNSAFGIPTKSIYSAPILPMDSEPTDFDHPLIWSSMWLPWHAPPSRRTMLLLPLEGFLRLTSWGFLSPPVFPWKWELLMLPDGFHRPLNILWRWLEHSSHCLHRIRESQDLWISLSISFLYWGKSWNTTHADKVGHPLLSLKHNTRYTLEQTCWTADLEKMMNDSKHKEKLTFLPSSILSTFLSIQEANILHLYKNVLDIIF